MQLQQACRKHAKIKMAIQGPSGSGKTMGALLTAYGLCGKWDKIVVIDTENHSSELYAHLGNYNVIQMDAPFSPERYRDAIRLCEKAAMDVIIIDSISHEWDGSGGILEIHGSMTGNSWTNWNSVTPRHNSFIQNILQSPAHVICTIRSKQEYVLSEKNGKQVPEKVGMKGVTREGTDFEFTLLLELDMKTNATATKDRTSLFFGKPAFNITPKTGEMILQWCNEGAHDELIELKQRINDCKTIGELLKLYTATAPEDEKVKNLFSARRNEIVETITQLSNSKTIENGTDNNATQ